MKQQPWQATLPAMIEPASSFLSITLPQLQRVDHPDFASAGISVDVLRLDTVHPVVSGNKWFKLKYNLDTAISNGAATLVSFGGAWSNHLHALACAGKLAGLQTLAFVRGELPVPLNDCLADCIANGMRLVPLSREEYRRRHDPSFVTGLLENIEKPCVIPEGGANIDGLRGCAEILQGIDQAVFHQVALACGTGTTLAGLLMTSSLPVLGIQVLKGEGYLRGEVASMLSGSGIIPGVDWRIEDRFHRGGYARVDGELLDFCRTFEDTTGVPIEPVYSGKLMMALCEMAATGVFPAGHRVLAIHGGGLQGKRGYFI